MKRFYLFSNIDTLDEIAIDASNVNEAKVTARIYFDCDNPRYVGEVEEDFVKAHGIKKV